MDQQPVLGDLIDFQSPFITTTPSIRRGRGFIRSPGKATTSSGSSNF